MERNLGKPNLTQAKPNWVESIKAPKMYDFSQSLGQKGSKKRPIIEAPKVRGFFKVFESNFPKFQKNSKKNSKKIQLLVKKFKNELEKHKTGTKFESD